MKNRAILFLVLIFISCNSQDNKMIDIPLITVIKLQSSEALLDFKSAKKYIDVEKVYGKYKASKNPQKEWKETITFFYNLGESKKNTNQFKYFKYNINTTINELHSKVYFISKDQNVKIKEIIYSLDKVKNRWIVVDIEYQN